MITFSQGKIKSKLRMVIGFYFVSTVHLPAISRLAIIFAKLIRIVICQLDVDLQIRRQREVRAPVAHTPRGGFPSDQSFTIGAHTMT
jgi:hypothetical protein